MTQIFCVPSAESYEAWNKPEEAKEWRTKLVQIEDTEE